MCDTAVIIFSNNVAFLLIISCNSVNDTTIHLVAQVGCLEAACFSFLTAPLIKRVSLSPIKSTFRNILWISLLLSVTSAITFCYYRECHSE